MQTFSRAKLANGIATIKICGDKFSMNPSYFVDDGYCIFGSHVGAVAELNSVLQWYGGDGTYCASPFHSGEFHPRIWRGEESPTPEQAGVTREWISSVRVGRLLFSRLRDLFCYIEPHPGNDLVHGLQQRELLILACTEVESAWKSILKANGVTKKDDSWFTKDFVRLLAPLRLDEWSVALSSHPDHQVIKPFEGWKADRPTQSLGWYDSYNAVKHDRENGMERATVVNMLHAMAAVFILNVAQFGTGHLDTGTPFHADEFRIVESPAWALSELYICPLRESSTSWLGYDRWTPLNCRI